MGNYSLKYLTQKPHYDKCKYCELCATRCKNTSKNTPLMDACINKNEEEALRLLEDYEKCNVECVNKDHDTALLLACKNKLTKVALKILENPEKCNIGYPDKYDCIDNCLW